MISNIFVLILTAVCYLDCQKGVALANEDPRVADYGAVIKQEPRKKQQEDSLIRRILPMLATPFIMQVTILPLVLMGMKFVLLNSMFFGKLGVIMWIIHLIRNNDNYGGGLYSHNVNIEHNDHTGHSNVEKNYRYSDHYNYRRRRRSTLMTRHLDIPTGFSKSMYIIRDNGKI